MTKYRAVALLTTFSKVLRKIMFNRLNHHMHTNNILVPEQFGFWKGIPTENAAFRLTVCYDWGGLGIEKMGLLCHNVCAYVFISCTREWIFMKLGMNQFPTINNNTWWL
jgi:hypothetical protein